ncbi:MAG TPA: signal peptidase II [Solirubrobacteraceae bacterium]
MKAAVLAALVAAAVVAADQLTKALVRAQIAPGEEVKVVPGVHLVRASNSGIAFSQLAGGGALVVVVALIALCALLAFFLTHLHRRLVWLPTGLLIGGAAGNLIDRIRLGAVTDFVKLPHWPAFNLADACITVGVITLVYVLERVR